VARARALARRCLDEPEAARLDHLLARVGHLIQSR
jgi:hypothetical protein